VSIGHAHRPPRDWHDPVSVTAHCLTASGGLRYNRPAVGMSERRVVPFPTPISNEPAPTRTQARRRPARDAERSAPPRRIRRRQSSPWLQRNALSIAAVAVLVSLLSVGFTLMQFLTRSDQTAGITAVVGLGPSQAGMAAEGDEVALDAPAAVAETPRMREIVRSARVLEPTYTVEAGDTLNRIAERFGTSVARIQALNDLADPRALRIGTRLVIPPPL